MLKFYPSIKLAISDSGTAFPHWNGDATVLPDELTQEKILSDNGSILELNEWQTYYIKFYSKELDDSIPKLFHQDNFTDSGTFITNKTGDIYTINYKNYVGLSHIGPVKIKVTNRKFTEQQYQSVLSCITEQYIDLVYQFSKTTERYGLGEQSHTGFSTQRNQIGNNLDYVDLLFLKRYLLDDTGENSRIDEIVNLVLKEPHYKIDSEWMDKSIEQIHHIDPGQLMKALSSGNNLLKLSPEHALANTALARKLKGYFPVQMKQQRKFHSFDTPENRFIKYYFDSLLQWLECLKKELQEKEVSYFNPRILQDIDDLYAPMKYCLDDPLWNEVATMRFIPSNSQVLQRREGYKQIFSLYSLMQLASHYDFNTFDFKYLLESKDTNILYEYWCFFILKNILDEHLGAANTINTLVNNIPDKLDQELTEGIMLYYKDSIQLGFNITFRRSNGSYSQEYRPDFIIKKDDRYLIFDAKHRLVGWDNENHSKPKKEDIDKMHTYKDAINHAVGAFILYPGDENVLYQSPGKDYGYEGVGAIRLVPEERKMSNGIYEKNNQLLELIYQFTGQENV